MPDSHINPRKLTLDDLCREPFRLFFPSAVVIGLLGVAQWPLHFGGYLPMYPGLGHSRLMAFGFFGGFIVGFLGTAGPRMLSAKPLRCIELAALLTLYWTVAGFHLAGRTVAGEIALIVWLVCLGGVALSRFLGREDMPPPGFVMLPLALLCAMGGASISIVEARQEVDLFWMTLRPLIAFQGFLALPLLGVGAYLLPHFLKLSNAHDFPESKSPPPGWTRQAAIALVAGLLIVVTFFIEASGRYRLAYVLRFVVIGGYLFVHLRALLTTRLKRDAVVFSIKFGVLCLPLGYLTLAVFPEWRIAWLHLVLVGGLAIVTLSVATRVILGHSGRRDLLMGRKGWFVIALVMMLFGLTSRMIGDFIPKILITHYNYGALCWGIGLAVWAWKVIPNVLTPDPDP